MLILDGKDKEDVFRLVMSLIKKFKLEDMIRERLNKSNLANPE